MSTLSRVLWQGKDGLLMFECPGCEVPHGIYVGDGAGPRWGWNGNVDQPTFTPSILVRGMLPLTDEAHAAWMLGAAQLPPAVPFVCHSFVVAGQIQFLPDCTHALAGQTVPIPDWNTKMIEDDT